MNMLKLEQLSVEKHVVVLEMLYKKMVIDIGVILLLGLIIKSQLKGIVQLFKQLIKLF